MYYTDDMKRDDVLQTLRQHRSELQKRFGVTTIALFGLTAREEATEQSDVDLLVDFNKPVGLFHLAETQFYLEGILGTCTVDLITPDGIRPALREQILSEAINA
jgi:predicted nucleotidyltransferase